MAARVITAAQADVIITTCDPSGRKTAPLLSEIAAELGAYPATWIGTTSFATDSQSAVATAVALQERLDVSLIKLDVRTADNVPDDHQTLSAARSILDLGLEVDLMPLITADLAALRSVERLGCVAVRVYASEIGSMNGIKDPERIARFIHASTIPVVVECGIGCAEDVVLALRLGASAILVNTAIAQSNDPPGLARRLYEAAIGESERILSSQGTVR